MTSEREPGPYWVRMHGGRRHDWGLGYLDKDGFIRLFGTVYLYDQSKVAEFGPRITREDAEELERLRRSLEEPRPIDEMEAEDISWMDRGNLEAHYRCAMANWWIVLHEVLGLRARVAELEGLLQRVADGAEVGDQCPLCGELLDTERNDNGDGELLGHDDDCEVPDIRAALSQPSADSPPHDDWGGKS